MYHVNWGYSSTYTYGPNVGFLVHIPYLDSKRYGVWLQLSGSFNPQGSGGDAAWTSILGL